MKMQDQRLKAGLSQSQLAKASGISLRTIQMYECGQRNIDGAGLEMLCALAAGIGCQIFDILESEKLIEQLKNVT